MIEGTELQRAFIFINVHTAKRLPRNIQGVPAILPAMQPETSLLHGSYAFSWVQSALGYQTATSGGPKMRGHPDPHGPQNPRSFAGDPGHAVVDSGGAQAQVTDKEFIGTAPYEMGDRGYSDRYSFIENDSGMSHRYTYVGEHQAPGVIGKIVTHEPGEALKDAKGVSQKEKELQMNLKMMQEERSKIGQGITRT